MTEAKPDIKWDKGNAAIHILRSAFGPQSQAPHCRLTQFTGAGVNWGENIRVIFAGDDLTDEDAMKALKVCKCIESQSENSGIAGFGFLFPRGELRPGGDAGGLPAAGHHRRPHDAAVGREDCVVQQRSKKQTKLIK